MSNMRYYRILAGAAALLLPLCSASFAQGRCSLDTVRGTWGWQSHGTAMISDPGSPAPKPVPYASLGIMEVDFQGRYTAHATISVGGQIQEVDFPGFVLVNADCTATDMYTIGPAEGMDRLVILGNGDEIEGMPVKHPLGPVAGTFRFRRITQGNRKPRCTAHMVRGVYAGLREGTQMMPIPGQAGLVPVPFSAIHTGTIRNDGTDTAASAASMGGVIANFEFPSVSIAVNPDCTATMTYTGVSTQFPGQMFTGAVKYIVLNQGDELIGMDIEANPGLPGVVLDNLKRISMAPVVPGQ